MNDPLEIRWIKTGIIAGFCASILYPLIIFAPLSLKITAACAVFLGPAIGIGSLGLRYLLIINRKSVAAALGAISNYTAGVLFTSMVLVQLAVKYTADLSTVSNLEGIWLGLDVAWDIYIGLGTLLFALTIIKHPRFGWLYSIPGFILGFLVIILNLIPFPIPPAAAGLIDIGPFVGIWYFVLTIQALRSIGWARQQLQS
jgi:hypothetical protein